MKVLAIESSCDETAVAILDAEGDSENARFKILGNALLSQIDVHREYGGVFPAVAKREHAKNFVPLLMDSLAEAELLREDTQAWSEEVHDAVAALLEREPELSEAFFAAVGEIEKPDIDAIAVTAGPGLEPALWVGVNFARALAHVWNLPLVPVNHLEGHILAGIAVSDGEVLTVAPPALPLLGLGIAGGHTDLVCMDQWLTYRVIGGTLDDSVGEAFDKVARMMGLPYPGGPEISKLAERDREDFSTVPFTLPRPMLHDGTCNFSFSGLKTAVLYLIKKHGELSDIEKEQLAREFEDAVTEVLWAKSERALEETAARTFVVSGGVAANVHIRRTFAENIEAQHPDVSLHFPTPELSTDNAVMIGIAGYFRALRNEYANGETLRADGNLSLPA